MMEEKLKTKTLFGSISTFPDLKRVEKCYTVSEFVENFKSNEIALESDLQTKERWAPGTNESFLKSVCYNTYVGEIVICHIDSCIEKAIKDGNRKDEKYFTSLKNVGKIYISCDGNHRSQTLWKYQYNDLSVFNHRNIKVLILMYISREELHEFTVNSNKQKSWNRQESRNAVISPVNDLVIELTKYNDILPSINVDYKRYKDREFYLSLVFILDNRYKSIIKGFNQNALDNLLNININPSVFINIKDIVELWRVMVKNFNQKSNMKIHKMFWVMLFLICDEILTNSTEDINEKYINYVTDNFIKIVNEIYNNETLIGKGGLFSLRSRMSFTNIDNRLEFFTNKIYINE